MSQLKSYLDRASGRLPRAVASTALILSAAAGGAILAGGEAKATQICDLFPPTPPFDQNPCIDNGWIVNQTSLVLSGSPQQIGNISLQGMTNIAEVVIDFSDVTEPGTSGEYHYSISNPDLIYQVGLDSSGLASTGVFDIYKYIYSDAGMTNLLGEIYQDETSGLMNITITPTETIYIRDTWTTSAMGINSISNSYQTPGPLPILGAGTAFGLSRKLRSRIKASRAA